MKNNILQTAFTFITILVTTTLGRTEARQNTAITLRAGDGAAIGVTFNAFPAWIGRIEAIGRLKKSAPYHIDSSEVKLRKYSLGGQGTLFWQLHFLKDLTIQTGPAIEISFIHDERKPTNVGDDIIVVEGTSIVPWLVAGAGYRVMRHLELFADAQFSPYGYYASDLDFEAGLRFGAYLGMRIFIGSR